MAKIFKPIVENNNIEALIQALTEQKENIKDAFCAVRFKDGTLWISEQDVPFETLCTISKKLDLIIDYRQQDLEIEIEEDEEVEE